jgi:hypothetical protein
MTYDISRLNEGALRMPFAGRQAIRRAIFVRNYGRVDGDTRNIR